ncbi:MAG TPA: hypothetical protein VEV64_08125 [Rhizomicrobium sp.]|nr:hypothetical protein [Rhizomicrobium sp.]
MIVNFKKRNFVARKVPINGTNRLWRPGSGRNSVDINRTTVALVGAAVKRRTPFFDDQRRLPHLQMEEMRTEQSCKFFGGIRLKQKGGTRQDRLGISDFA